MNQIQLISKNVYKTTVKPLKQAPDCCYIKLNGKHLPNKTKYFKRLAKKLQLNDSFHRNLDAYVDMMCDHYTYYNRDNIVFVITHYEHFLEDEHQRALYLQLFADEIIPYFTGNGQATIAVYGVE